MKDAVCLALLAGVLSVTACSSDEGSWRSGNGELTVNRVAAPAPANVGSLDSATMAVYAVIANVSGAADTLTAVEARDARSATLHATMDHGGTKMMMPTTTFVVPAGAWCVWLPARPTSCSKDCDASPFRAKRFHSSSFFVVADASP